MRSSRSFAASEDPDVVHVAGIVNPLDDIETVEIELMLADIQMLERFRAERAAKGGDKDAILRAEVIRQCQAHLATDQPLRKLALDPLAAAVVTNFGLLSAKPILYVANVDESDLAGTGPLVQQVREFAAKVGAGVVPVCAKFEAELAELDDAGRAEMLAAAGLTEPALPAVARAAFQRSSCRATSRPARRKFGVADPDRGDGPASGRGHPH